MSITFLIIILTVAASFFAWSRPDIYEKWMMIPYKVKSQDEYYRFLTSGFIHTGYVHLGFNMISFYFFAGYVEKSIGTAPFILLYILGMIISDIPTFLKEKENPSYSSLGASGAVSAVVFSSILLNPLNTIIIYFIEMPGFIFGALYLIYSYYQSKNSEDNIGHEAHFYGALFGIIFTIILFPQILEIFFEKISFWFS
jgi:membrane associated rhomboid family serine protease